MVSFQGNLFKDNLTRLWTLNKVWMFKVFSLHFQRCLTQKSIVIIEDLLSPKIRLIHKPFSISVPLKQMQLVEPMLINRSLLTYVKLLKWQDYGLIKLIGIKLMVSTMHGQLTQQIMLLEQEVLILQLIQVIQTQETVLPTTQMTLQVWIQPKEFSTSFSSLVCGDV